MTYLDLKRSTARAAAVALTTLAFLATTSGAAFAKLGSGGVGPGGGGVSAGGSSDGEFPVLGKHTYGDGFGAGRDHQGQDLLAECGKPVVAAQPGRVQLTDYHGAAGNYVVIDGSGKLEDTVYMHLQRKAAVRKAEQVEAGEVIGRVGDTGNTTACHLHFEIWSNPGYYEGGSAIDPTQSLKRWDADR